MDIFKQTIQNFQSQKYDYQEKLSNKKHKRMELYFTQDYLKEDIERLTDRIEDDEHIIERLTNLHREIDYVKTIFKDTVKINALASILIALIALLISLICFLPITQLFLFVVLASSLYMAMSTMIDSIKPIKALYKCHKFKSRHNQSNVERDLKRSKYELIKYQEEYTKNSEQLEKMNTVIKELEALIQSITIHINVIAKSRENAIKKLNGDAKETELNELFNKDKKVQNIMRLERKKKK